MNLRDLFFKSKPTTVEMASVMHPITLNPNKKDQAVRAAGRLSRLYATRDKQGTNPELEADIQRYQKALRLAEIAVPSNAEEARALMAKLEG